MTDEEKNVSFTFAHGVGDCALFAPACKLWKDRGYNLTVNTPNDDRQYFFKAVGVNVNPIAPNHISMAKDKTNHHRYFHPSQNMFPASGENWLGNKVAHNLSQSPLPNIGTTAELWKEYLDSRHSLLPFVPHKSKIELDRWLGNTGSVILLHTRGNTSASQKNFSPLLEEETYRALLERTSSTVLLLDWDNRVYRPEYHSERLVHMGKFRRLSLLELAYLMAKCHCFVGVDSGPLHMAEKWSSCRTVGVWFEHHPCHYSVPRVGVRHLVPKTPRNKVWNRQRGSAFGIVECAKITGELIADTVLTQVSELLR